MGSGKDFEDSLMDALEEWVGDDGYPMLRKQEMASRRGNFQMSQELDILVDSRYEEYYIGIEAKSRDVESSGPGMYFSRLNPDQFLEQENYREVSGRNVAVAVELRNCCESEDGKNDCAFLLPLDLFVRKIHNDDTKVSWDEVREYGVYLGSNGEFSFSTECFESVQGTNRDTDVDLSRKAPQSVEHHESGGDR
jgi:hypothetical protein